MCQGDGQDVRRFVGRPLWGGPPRETQQEGGHKGRPYDEALPTDIFAFDVMPCAAGPTKHVTGGVDMPMSPDK
jgi:hypothetical protein